ncbi:hypothetical protein SAMN04487831_102397 [Pseudobutyrivibrio sp. UC1225]|uniref:hypothetical protein n=1 Tax=Pseudobutyrivibrio sp. UC1225 TaxID=1798185 RepID=UPI0008F39077|nr:hypothetical protein [Pseudobutyrivibrio sp. UC1225]SFN67964.1 hypothetical protein SAMN04487831_102397 [Pseudobutyrivibrio sp. UC1225]
MKNHYKAASLALAGVLAVQTFVPMSAMAEEEENQVLVENEAAEAVAEQSNTATDETSNETTEVTVILSDDTNKEGTDEIKGEVVVDGAPAADETSSEESSEEETEEEEKTEEELLADEELELLEAKEDEDFNGDGISDLHTKMLCEGEILTETGKKVFGDYSYLQVQQSNDLDADGLSNGEEVVIETREDGSLYAVLVSDPCKADTDEDGIKDYDDTDKWHRGLYGGVLGSVRLVARHDDSKNFRDGHVYLVYTSYVDNLEISLDKLYGYYIANPEYADRLREACDNDDSVVSWRSTLEEINEAAQTDTNEAIRIAKANDMYVDQEIEHFTKGTVILNRGEYVTIGNYSMSTPEEELEKDYIPYLMNEGMTKEDIAKLTEFANKALNEQLTEEYVAANYLTILKLLDEHGQSFGQHVAETTTEGGVWINRELYNQKYAYDQGPNEVVEQEFTERELNVMLDAFDAHSYVNAFNHNCTTVGALVWNEAYGTKKDENGNTVKTDYYVNSGVQVKQDIQNPISGNVFHIDTKVDYPGAVKESIKAMVNLPGYIGQMTYVTGKKVVDTVINTVKKFNISKLFTKKTKSEETTPVVTPVQPSNGGSNSSNSTTVSNNTAASNSTSSISTASSSRTSSASASTTKNAGTVDTLTSVTAEDLADEEIVVAANVAPTVKKSASKKVASTEEATFEEEETEEAEEEVVEEEEEEIVQESPVEETKIDDEEVPTVAKETKSLTWIWVSLVAVIAAAGIGTAFAFSKKKK